jgi:hypothetical protein
MRESAKRQNPKVLAFSIVRDRQAFTGCEEDFYAVLFEYAFACNRKSTSK